MKILRAIRIAVGLMFIATGFFGMAEDFILALVCLAIGAVLIVWPMLRAKKKGSGSNRPANRNDMTTFKVAGVSFDNDDGSSRQQILQKLYNGKKDGPVSFRPYTYKGEPAMHVLCAGRCVGSVPRDRVADVRQIIPRITVAKLNIEHFYPDDKPGKQMYRADCIIQYSK